MFAYVGFLNIITCVDSFILMKINCIFFHIMEDYYKYLYIFKGATLCPASCSPTDILGKALKPWSLWPRSRNRNLLLWGGVLSPVVLAIKEKKKGATLLHPFGCTENLFLIALRIYKFVTRVT